MRLSNKTNSLLLQETGMLRHEMLKAKIEGYRFITTTNKESTRKVFMILVSKNYKAKEKKARKMKN